MGRATERRKTLRDLHWKGSQKKIWWVRKYDGFTSIPRLLSLVCVLINRLKGKKAGDPTAVYVDLWCRAWEEGVVENIDEDDCAFSSGYTGSRARRTWTAHVWELERLGFIKVAREGNRDIAHILMLDPIEVCISKQECGKVPDEWWSAFVRRAADIGTDITPPPLPPAPPPTPPMTPPAPPPPPKKKSAEVEA